METRTALRIFGICGLVSVLVDLDHLISLLLYWYVSTKFAEGRLWHTPLFILSCLGICYLVAHFRGLYPKLVLVGIVVVTVLVLLVSPLVIWRP